MKNILKFTSLLFALTFFMACENNDEIFVNNNLSARYTFVREALPAGTIRFINTSQNANSFTWDFGDGTSSQIKDPVKTFNETGEYIVTLTAINTNTGETATFSSTISIFIFQGGLILNGDFEGGIAPWRMGVDNPIPAAFLVSENNNTYYSIFVGAAGNAFDVNLSQVGINMTQGTTYRVTFDAWS
ncbi:PKD domain-containing protein, partial [Arthrospira platensis SPKY1]|nr:PKD domain-containing protein [Arthrospira platensis SPKY1]